MLHCIDSGIEIELFDTEHIVDNKENNDKPIISGIYILMDRTKIVYVGSSINIHQRIKQHRKTKKMMFNYWFIHPVYNRDAFISNTREALLRIEKAYIEKYNPKYNTVYTEEWKAKFKYENLKDV